MGSATSWLLFQHTRDLITGGIRYTTFTDFDAGSRSLWLINQYRSSEVVIDTKKYHCSTGFVSKKTWNTQNNANGLSSCWQKKYARNWRLIPHFQGQTHIPCCWLDIAMLRLLRPSYLHCIILHPWHNNHSTYRFHRHNNQMCRPNLPSVG